VPSENEILAALRRDQGLSALLAEEFEFDVQRGQGGESGRIASGEALESVAGDLAGDTFYLCGAPGAERPLLYVTSEGQAGLIADNLAAGLELIIGAPYWRDCLGFSGGGDLETMRLAARFLQRDLAEKDANAGRRGSAAAEALSLTLQPVGALLERLHSAVSRTSPDFTFSEEGFEFEGLFGPFTPARNPMWR